MLTTHRLRVSCAHRPLAIVGNTFSIAWEARGLALISENIKMNLLLKGHSANSLEAARLA